MTAEAEQRLLSFVEDYVRSRVAGGEPPTPPVDEAFQLLRGLFVTLRVRGDLRGCIGSIEPRAPLAALAAEMADAALADERFVGRRIQGLELDGLEVELTLLAEPRAITGLEEFEVGRDGVIIEVGARRGVFLPQVAVEQGWTAEQTFEECCRHKLCLPPGAWRLPGARLFAFEGRKIRRSDAVTD